jgi:hypothetical protein
MRTVAKTICCGVALMWMQGAGAGDVAVSEQAGTIVLESVAAQPDAVQSASAPANAPVQAQPEQGASSAARVPVKAYYEKVDRAHIEKRIADRAARTKKRSLEAEKDAAERAAKAQVNQTTQQGGQGTQNAQ